MLRDALGREPIANVIRDDSMIEPIRKYFALDIVPYEYGVFRSVEEARAWIAARTGVAE